MNWDLLPALRPCWQKLPGGHRDPVLLSVGFGAVAPVRQRDPAVHGPEGSTRPSDAQNWPAGHAWHSPAKQRLTALTSAQTAKQATCRVRSLNTASRTLVHRCRFSPSLQQTCLCLLYCKEEKKPTHFYPWSSNPVPGYRFLWGRAQDDYSQDKCSQLGRAEGWSLAPGSETLEDRACTLPALKPPGTSLVKTFKHWRRSEEKMVHATFCFYIYI